MDSAKAIEYSDAFLLNPQFQLLIDGLWALDHGSFDVGYLVVTHHLQEALHCLADPAVFPDWASKIVNAFYSCGQLLHASQFIHMTQPGSWANEDILMRMDLFLQNDLVAAFNYQRLYHNHSLGLGLFHSVLNSCFAHSSQLPRIQLLLGLSFTPLEEQMLRDYCLQSVSQVAKDFLFMYYLHRGRAIEALDIHKLCSPDTKRQKIVDALLATLPDIQKLAIQVQQQVSVDERKESKVSPRSASPCEYLLILLISVSERTERRSGTALCLSSL